MNNFLFSFSLGYGISEYVNDSIALPVFNSVTNINNYLQKKFFSQKIITNTCFILVKIAVNMWFTKQITTFLRKDLNALQMRPIKLGGHSFSVQSVVLTTIVIGTTYIANQNPPVQPPTQA